MKRLFPLLLATLLAINILAGLMLSCYPLFNMILNSVVLCVAALLGVWVNKKVLSSAFLTSLSFIIPFMTFVQFIIGIFAPSQFQDNWGLIAILFLMAFEVFLTYAVTKRSEKSILK